MDRLGELIDTQVATFTDLGSQALVEIAKNDHVTFKKRIADVMTGRKRGLSAHRLPDHHACRLGQWYDSMQHSEIATDPAFRALPEPHQRVHEAGKEALRRFQHGDHVATRTEVEHLEASSQQVIGCLDRLGASLAARMAA